MRIWQTFSHFALSELVCTKNVFYPILLFPTFSPQASSPLERSRQRDRQTNFNTPCYLSSFFFPLSARGPTRRRNSTGLAELWGGWPIEQDSRYRQASCAAAPPGTFLDQHPVKTAKKRTPPRLLHSITDGNSIGRTTASHQRRQENDFALMKKKHS